MPTYSVPQAQWREALDAFSLSHFAWPVSVEVVSPDMGVQPEVVELPLGGISVDDTGGHPAVAISMSREAPEHVTHLVQDVAAIRFQREGNVDQAIEIQTLDGTRTILRFAPPVNRVVSTTVH
ncbi:MAG: DUF5335 family protein [Vicinamibacterales bacterium]